MSEKDLLIFKVGDEHHPPKKEHIDGTLELLDEALEEFGLTDKYGVIVLPYWFDVVEVGSDELEEHSIDVDYLEQVQEVLKKKAE